VIWRLWASLWRSADQRPLQWAFAFVILAFAGSAISLYPYIGPYQFTFSEFANDPVFMKWAGVGLCVALPGAVLYLLISYRTLRAKTRPAAVVERAPPALASRRTCGNNVDLHLS
jgi:cytochrome bd-type quinol oxidase subunit 2